MTDKGFTDKIKGKAKEVTGDITGDKELKSEGLVDQGIGKAKEVKENVKDVANELTEKAKDKLNKKD
ncbi:CsbD family protein [Vagococcus sp.]|uniref:CsbD family protein n=1 Tax=Vagococcus sp. TaxID=1933889 RepID=UPI003F9989F7